jgi:hypothetical protein
VEDRPSDVVVVDMPLAATGRETSQLGSGRPAEKLEAAIQDKRLATEPYSSSVCDSGLVNWSFNFTYCGMPWWAGYDGTGAMVSAK